MREEEPSPNASPPLEELRASPSPRRGKRSCSCRVSHCRASWLLMREPREPLPSRRRGTREREPSRWSPSSLLSTCSCFFRTDGRREPQYPQVPENKVTRKSFFLLQQIPFIQSYAGDVNQVIHIFEKIGAAGRVVAVAIENNKTSQDAAKWTVDNLLPKDQVLVLIHVRQQASSIRSPYGNLLPVNGDDDLGRAYRQQMENETKELFGSFRVFCNRKNIQCKEILLEDTDIPKAIINSITSYSIELLVLGSSKSSFLKKIRGAEVPNQVSKGAPPFCTVYVINKGKISTVRYATAQLTVRPRNSILPLHSTQSPSPSESYSESQFFSAERFDSRLTRNHPPRPLEKPGYHGRQSLEDFSSPINKLGRPEAKPYEPSMTQCDISFVNGKPGVDKLFSSLYDESVDDGAPPRLSLGSDFGVNLLDCAFTSQETANFSDGYSFNSQDEVETEMRRLKLELEQSMDVYSTACREALVAKQKALELRNLKMREWKKFHGEQTAEKAELELATKEKEKCRAASNAAEVSRKIAELEAKKKMNCGMRMRAEAELKQSGEGLLYGGSARYRRYTVEEIEAATKGFSNALKVGEGGYGPVYKCELDHTLVAIKVLKTNASQGWSQFHQEIEVLSCIRHPHMVLLLGACPEIGCLVYEYMANGSLDDCLFHRGNAPVLPWQLRFRIAAEIATALLFLHQTKPEPLVHRDLKPGNILLDRNLVSKIGDVGLARLVPPSVSDVVTQYRLTSTAGTFCYIDPEYQQTGMLGVKSDIYSLGVMLLQIITARSPMGLTHQVAKAIQRGTFAEMLDPAVEDWPIQHALHFAKIGLRCAEMKRKDRPDLAKVVLPELNKLRQFAEENTPMMMFGVGAGFASRSTTTSLFQDTSETQSFSEISESSLSSTPSIEKIESSGLEAEVTLGMRF
nr:U-box domain-containing protein 51 isoform X3 [Arachis hypogaea]